MQLITRNWTLESKGPAHCQGWLLGGKKGSKYLPRSSGIQTPHGSRVATEWRSPKESFFPDWGAHMASKPHPNVPCLAGVLRVFVALQSSAYKWTPIKRAPLLRKVRKPAYLLDFLKDVFETCCCSFSKTTLKWSGPLQAVHGQLPNPSPRYC